MKDHFSKTFIFIIFLFSFFIFSPNILAWAGSFAQMNPDFTDFQAEKKIASSETGGYLRGKIPSPVDLSHLKGISLSQSGFNDHPESYDLREMGYIGPVRNQSPYGSCWTFAALASLESTSRKLLGRELDLSERYMMYFAYIDEFDLPGFGDCSSSDFPGTANYGGDDFRATALLSRWTGAVLEEDVPYDDLDMIPTGLEDDAVHLQHVYYLYMDMQTRYSDVNIANIKHALMNYGAVAVGVYADDAMAGYWPASDYYDSSTYAAYIPEGNPDHLSVGSANHEVSIVGWDNTFASTDFPTQPPGDGAWIVRNSWGTNWGDEGYYYLSYYDSVLDTGAAYVGETPDNYRTIYHYDPLGWVNSYSPAENGNDTAWMANVFTSARTEVLKAVSFYTGGKGNTYEISLIDGIDGEVIYGPQSGTLPDPGYHTVDLEEPLLFEKGKELAVSVQLTTPGYDYPVALEYSYPGYTDNATALPGQSYVSEDGDNWVDTTSVNETANVCLKAFAGPASLNIPGLRNIEESDLTGTPEGDLALEKAEDTIEKLDPVSFDIQADGFRVLDLMDYRILTGMIESGETGIELEASSIPYHDKRKYERYILLLAWNYDTERFDVISAERSDKLSSSTDGSLFMIEDGGVYESPKGSDGVLRDLQVMEVVVTSDPLPETSGGGCATGKFPLFALLLLVPSLLLSRRFR